MSEELTNDFIFWYTIMAITFTVVALFLADWISKKVYPLKYVKEPDNVAVPKEKTKV